MKQVNEVKMNNVIPFDKTKSGVSIRQTQIINKTFSQLYEHLSRINRFSLYELRRKMNGLCEEDKVVSPINRSGVFDPFYIGDEETNTRQQVCFGYDRFDKIFTLYQNITHYDETKSFDDTMSDYEGFIDIPKDEIKTKLGRQKCSKSLCESIFSHIGGSDKMKDTDKVYEVKITPLSCEDNILLRVPEGIEIDKETIYNSTHFEDSWSKVHNFSVKITEVDKELWDWKSHPSVESDGSIEYHY